MALYGFICAYKRVLFVCRYINRLCIKKFITEENKAPC